MIGSENKGYANRAQSQVGHIFSGRRLDLERCKQVKQSLSIVEIAELAGVSPTTVSRVFRGNAYVKAETKDMVLAIARDHGFQPRQYTKRITLLKHNAAVAIIVPDIENPFFQQIIRAIIEVFDQHGIELMICDTNETPNKEIRHLNLLHQLNVDGIIITPTSENAEYNGAFLKELYDKGLPIVVLDRDVKGIGLSGIFQNSYDAAFSAVDTLVANGHRHIAIIGGPITSKPGLDRTVGYMDALKSHGITVQQEYIFYGDFKAESGYALTQRLLKDHHEVTAIFAANNLMSIGSLQAIKEAGLNIPEDIAFISYGSLRPFETGRTGDMTEITEPTELMGYECAQLLLEKMATGKRKDLRAVKRVSFDAHITLRGSEKFPANRPREM